MLERSHCQVGKRAKLLKMRLGSLSTRKDRRGGLQHQWLAPFFIHNFLFGWGHKNHPPPTTFKKKSMQEQFRSFLLIRYTVKKDFTNQRKEKGQEADPKFIISYSVSVVIIVTMY